MPSYSHTVYFDGNELSALSGVAFTARKVSDIPKRSLSIGKLARADKSILTSAEYSDKEISFDGIIFADDGVITAEQRMADLLALCQNANSELKIERFGFNVTYTATLSGYTTDFVGGDCTFTMTFVATDPFAYEVNNTQLIQPINITTATNTSAVTVSGSYKAAPVFTVNVYTLTGSSNSITINNAEIGSGITVTRTWAANDTLVINCLTMQVTVNGTEVDFTGLFPSFNVGTGSVNYIDDFTARSVVLSAVYKRRFV